MTYARYRERGFARWPAFVGAMWWRTGLGLRLHIRHLFNAEREGLV
jgi:hypothetical protein